MKVYLRFLIIGIIFFSFEAYSKQNDSIFHSIIDGDIASVEVYVERGNDINAIDDSYSSLLLVALEQDRYHIADLLIEKGADVNLGGIYGKTPLMEASFKGKKDMMQKLRRSEAVIEKWC